MADANELFRMLEDGTTGNGLAPTKKNEGDAVSGANEMPVLPCKDDSGNFQHISARVEGETATAVEATPGLVAKDNSGNLDYLNINADGTLAVSTATPGTPISARGTIAAVVGTATDAAAATLTTTETYTCIKWSATSSKTTLWQLVQDDNASETIIEERITGPGSYDFESLVDYGKHEITAGATGTQELIVRGTQLTGTGSASDLHGRVSALEKV